MSDLRKEYLDIIAQVRAHLDYLRVLGITAIPIPGPAEASEARPAPMPPARESRMPGPAASHARSADAPAAPAGVRQASTMTLEGIRAEIGDCTRCKLYQGRTNIVFGEGDPQAAVLFVGEGPGFEEDQQGRPFVGAAGQLLTDIIEKGMKIKRAEVYICNIVKCRPPGNRNPEPDEVDACIGFVKKQIQAVRPKVIVTLGNVPTQNLLGTKQGITRVRGNWQEYEGIPVMPTFHPSYLLRSPGEKGKVWEDIKKVMGRLGLAVPARESGARSQESGENR